MSSAYAAAGVDYDPIDAFKREAQYAALYTAGNSVRRKMPELRASRGESAYVLNAPTRTSRWLAFVDEGLGTKNLVADSMSALTGKPHYYGIGIDTVAMAVNDLITCGAVPLAASMHLKVGSSAWFADRARYSDLIHGWMNACQAAGCNWGPGETPVLKGIIAPETCALSCAVVGDVRPYGRLIRGEVQHGDAIVFLGASGIHANGLTLARAIADTLPEGYLTRLSTGRTYGETLLDPTVLYGRFVEGCLDAGVRIRYMVNITGHGWRKLMRLDSNFAYMIDEVPQRLPIFDFVQKHAAMDDRDAYQTFNMGAGFALYVHPKDVEKVLRQRHYHNMEACVAGHIESSRDKKVTIRPLDIEYGAETLAIR